MIYKIAAFAVLLFLVLPVAVAVDQGDFIPLTIRVTDGSDNPLPGTYVFEFNISSSSTCSPVVYTDKATLTTSTSAAIVSRNLDNIGASLEYGTQYWICMYRDGIYKDQVKYSRPLGARNVSWGGVIDRPTIVNDNSSWNQSLANTLYAPIIWGYNQTQPAEAWCTANLNETTIALSINTTANIKSLGFFEGNHTAITQAWAALQGYLTSIADNSTRLSIDNITDYARIYQFGSNNFNGSGNITAGNINVSSLTSGRIVYSGANGLTDSANLAFDGNTLSLNNTATTYAIKTERTLSVPTSGVVSVGFEDTFTGSGGTVSTYINLASSFNDARTITGTGISESWTGTRFNVLRGVTDNNTRSIGTSSRTLKALNNVVQDTTTYNGQGNNVAFTTYANDQQVTISPTYNGNTKTANYNAYANSVLWTSKPVLTSGTLNMNYTTLSVTGTYNATGNSASYLIYNSASGADVDWFLFNAVSSPSYFGSGNVTGIGNIEARSINITGNITLNGLTVESLGGSWYFYNSSGSRIMRLNQTGDLAVRGIVEQNAAI